MPVSSLRKLEKCAQVGEVMVGMIRVKIITIQKQCFDANKAIDGKL